MNSTKLVTAILAVGAALAAAAGGAMVANWSQPKQLQTVAATPTPIDATELVAVAPAPGATVQESEALVEPAASPAPAVEAVTAPAKPAPVAASRAPAASAARPASRTASRTPTQTPQRREPATSPAPAAPAETGTLARSWPSRTSTPPEAPERVPDPPVEIERTPLPDPTPTAEPEPPPPPERQYEDLVVPADAVMGLQLETALSSDTAKIEDRVEARVTRDIRVGGRVAIPAGTQVIGSVTQVQRGGKFRERSKLGIRFHTVVMADGARTTVQTDTIYREGPSPGTESAAKIGGAAVGGAILGAILGGKKGAAIGAGVGAAGGTATVAASERNSVTLPAGTAITVRVMAPMSVTVEK
jgi:hypothetical protein